MESKGATLILEIHYSGQMFTNSFGMCSTVAAHFQNIYTIKNDTDHTYDVTQWLQHKRIIEKYLGPHTLGRSTEAREVQKAIKELKRKKPLIGTPYKMNILF